MIYHVVMQLWLLGDADFLWSSTCHHVHTQVVKNLWRKCKVKLIQCVCQEQCQDADIIDSESSVGRTSHELSPPCGFKGFRPVILLSPLTHGCPQGPILSPLSSIIHHYGNQVLHSVPRVLIRTHNLWHRGNHWSRFIQTSESINSL